MAEHILFGLHSVLSCLQHQPELIKKIMLSESREDKRAAEISTLATQIGISIEKVDKSTVEKFAQNSQHQGVIAFCKEPRVLDEHDIPLILSAKTGPAFVVVLDGIQDPHNLGACLRSCNAAGVDMVIIPKDKATQITPVVSKVASGAAQVTPIISVTNLARALRLLQDEGIWLYGFAGEATDSLYSTDFTGNIGLIFGSEGTGMRRLTRDHCDGLVKIPMKGTVESLNVSVATGIATFEVLRQRLV